MHALSSAWTGRTVRSKAFWKLVEAGMKLLVRIEAAQARSDAKIDKHAEIWRKPPPNAHSRR
jgi:hypothetical protein